MRCLKHKLLLIVVFFVVSSLCTFHSAHATSYTVYDTVISIYTQSPSDGGAHLIRSSKGIYQDGEHPWCGNRAYIDFTDRELFATALAASLTGKPMNFFYEDAAESRFVHGHTTSKCRVFSIWQ